MTDKTIFDFMSAWDKKDHEFFSRLDVEDQTALDNFVSYISLRWMSGSEKTVDHQLAILQVNDINKGYFDLYNHKKMQALLMMTCGLGYRNKKVYIKPPTNKSDDPLYNALKKVYKTANNDDCDFLIETHTEEELLQECQKLGINDKEELLNISKAITKYKNAAK